MIELIRVNSTELTITFFAFLIMIVSVVVFLNAKGRRNVLHYLFPACTFTLVFWIILKLLPQIANWYNS